MIRRIAFAAWVLAVGIPALAGVREVGAIGLTVNDLGRELKFFTNTLPFQLVALSEARGGGEDAFLGLRDVQLRVATLRLGGERLTLTEHIARKGRPIPADSRSVDRWFQHIAIVVSDMDKAYAWLVDHRVAHVSTAPQTLPAWNKAAGGIRAFYFRDPEDHVLEIIWFPNSKGDPRWQRPASGLFLGIDHTAIVVGDTEASLAFYRDQLGFRVVGEAHNHGAEQEHLNQVFGARLRITALRAEGGPGIELLEYLAPPGGRGLPADAKANDLVFWNTQLLTEQSPELRDRLRKAGARFVSHSRSRRRFIVRDPDGHAMALQDGAGSDLTTDPF